MFTENYLQKLGKVLMNFIITLRTNINNKLFFVLEVSLCLLYYIFFFLILGRMEFFPEISSQMLHEFDALLQHSPSPIGNSRLLQLMAVNMFAIDNTASTGNHSNRHLLQYAIY